MEAILKRTFYDESFDPETGLYYYGARYLGDTRIVTKLNSGENPTYQEESRKQYYYHSDHLGSASLISDYQGDEYQRLEYTPYGETWVEKTSNTGLEYLPYKFTGKELDEETGLYYYGARYLDPKYSMWLSCDPALSDYMAGSDAGLGGVYNSVNLNLYHYANNNPVKYTDPTGMWVDNEDGTYTAEEGDTLHGLYGDDWQEKSGFTRDPTTLQVGETVGKKINEESPEIAGNLNTSTSSVLQSSQIQSSNPTNGDGYYSKSTNFLIGLGEVVTGLGIMVGGCLASAGLAPGTVGASAMIGYDAVITGGATFAYGLTRMTGANNKPFGEDVKNILVPPMATFADIDLKRRKQ